MLRSCWGVRRGDRKGRNHRPLWLTGWISHPWCSSAVSPEPSTHDAPGLSLPGFSTHDAPGLSLPGPSTHDATMLSLSGSSDLGGTSCQAHPRRWGVGTAEEAVRCPGQRGATWMWGHPISLTPRISPVSPFPSLSLPFLCLFPGDFSPFLFFFFFKIFFSFLKQTVLSLYSLCHNIAFIVFFLLFGWEACGIWAPRPRSNPHTWHWKARS